jgi:sugar phosphate isomerase/epimerase
MDVGIFAKIFKRATLEETLDAVCAHGLRAVQFNMACAGVPTLPEHTDHALIARIQQAMDARGLEMVAISGTYNMIHPDVAQRAEGLRRLGELLQACHALNTPIVSVCTGTRDATNMWRKHPANDTPQAWHDLLAVMRNAAEMPGNRAGTVERRR